MELRDYLELIWRRRWLIVLAFAVASGSALLFSSQITPQYVSTSKVFIGPRSVDKEDTASALQELYFSRELIASYAQVLRSRGMAEKVIEGTKREISAGDLSERIETRIIPETRIIEVKVTDPSPTNAQLFADTIAQIFVENSDSSFGGGASVSASVFERALLPSAPVSPKPLQNGLIGGFLGLLLGVGTVFLLEQLDLTLRNRATVERVLSPLPILATVPTNESRRSKRLLAFKDDSSSMAADAYRILRTNLQYLAGEDQVRRILVTSPGPEEGKSTVAANLAASYALAGYETALIDTDLRRPVAHEYFGLPRGRGIADALVSEAGFQLEPRPTPVPNLVLIEAGTPPPNPTELLGSTLMAKLLEGFDQASEIQIFDSPPALAVADTTVLGSAVEGVLLVIRAGSTHRSRAIEAKQAFERLGVRLLGIVFNDVDPSAEYGYYHYNRAKQKSREAGVPANWRAKRRDEWQFPQPLFPAHDRSRPPVGKTRGMGTAGRKPTKKGK